MRDISHTAKFSPADTYSRILEDLACPSCGHQDPGVARSPITHNKIRVFCDSCGAFITISINDEQASAIHRSSAPDIVTDRT